MTRVFVAAELPESVKQSLSAYEESLKRSDARLNLVDPDLSHITLKFIGEVDAVKLKNIEERLSAIKYSPYTMRLSGISFNNPRSPRVVWVNGSDGGGSARLAAMIEESLADLGIPKEERQFKIHVTLARIKEYHPSPMPIVKGLGDEDVAEFEITGFSLKKSVLTPKGPIYSDIMRVDF
ncbi:MAG: RNA 2',3'-cyclic phosphodiesterase [Methanomicrobium sp.]|nr:RNA 2',3'-cyclic phosphodiesterase [Methanomicrobium sp.]